MQQYLWLDRNHNNTQRLVESCHRNEVNLIDIHDHQPLQNIDDHAMHFCTGETSVAYLLRQLSPNSPQVKAAAQLQNKIHFRKMLEDWYPNFLYHHGDLNTLAQSYPQNKTMVLKPSKGHFSSGVKIIHDSASILSHQNTLQELRHHYNDRHIWNFNEWILEEYVEGREYAVDMYYDQEGTPQIVHCYYHPKAKVPAYQHLSYTLHYDEAIFNEMYRFFYRLGRRLSLKQFALHAEFIDGKQGLIPVECNPLRWGGEGLADISWHCSQVDAYHHLWTQQKIDLKNSHNYNVVNAFVFAYIPKNYREKSNKVNHEKFKTFCREVKYYQAISSLYYPVFAIAFCQMQPSQHSKLMQSDLTSFFDL